MEEFLKKRETTSFSVATGELPKPERFLKFCKSEHREFWLLPNKKKHGPENILFDGTVTSQRTWKQGFLHGPETNFTYCGKRYEIRTWKEGVRHGLSTRFYKTRTTENWWEEGKLLYGKSWSHIEGRTLLAYNLGTLTTYRTDGTISRISSEKIMWSFYPDGRVTRYFI
nr:hypothetical protein [Marseillevirus cajuinensis]